MLDENYALSEGKSLSLAEASGAELHRILPASPNHLVFGRLGREGGKFP